MEQRAFRREPVWMNRESPLRRLGMAHRLWAPVWKALREVFWESNATVTAIATTGVSTLAAKTFGAHRQAILSFRRRRKAKSQNRRPSWPVISDLLARRLQAVIAEYQKRNVRSSRMTHLLSRSLTTLDQHTKFGKTL
jgi:hypothetical protein